MLTFGIAMKKVKITAVRRTEYPDLMMIYENPIEHACEVAIGQEWVSVDGHKPEGDVWSGVGEHAAVCGGSCPGRG